MALNIKELSKELDVSLENLLAGVAREELLFEIVSSKVGRNLWLISPDDLGEKNYRQKKNLTIEMMDMAGGETIMELLDILKLKGLKVRETGDILWVDKIIDGMRVPLKIHIKKGNGGATTPLEKKATLLRGKASFTYFHYPKEAEVAEDLFKIFNELELIGDIGVYDRVAKAVTTLPLDGKLVWSILDGEFKAKGKTPDLGVIEIVKGYTGNSYLRKTWDKYNKRQDNESFEWKKVITVIQIFATPLWDALENDRVFIGDWMPELGRFL